MPAPALKLAILALSAAWLASLVQPVAATGRQGTFDGFAVGAIGPMGMAIGQFGWFANLLLPIQWRRSWPLPYTRSARIDLVLGGILMLLAIDTCFWNDIPTDAGSDPIIQFGSGYFLWMASLIGTAILAVSLSRKRARTA
jgi:hypothetical protein